jgi:hypothetical protein
MSNAGWSRGAVDRNGYKTSETNWPVKGETAEGGALRAPLTGHFLSEQR